MNACTAVLFAETMDSPCDYAFEETHTPPLKLKKMRFKNIRVSSPSMDGWMDEMDGWMDGWIVGWMEWMVV